MTVRPSPASAPVVLASLPPLRREQPRAPRQRAHAVAAATRPPVVAASAPAAPPPARETVTTPSPPPRRAGRGAESAGADATARVRLLRRRLRLRGMNRLRGIRGLGHRTALVAVAVVVGVGAGLALGAAFPASSPSPAARAPEPSRSDPVLARVLGPLDRARVRDRSALQRARSPRQQAVLADRLADDHQQALIALGGGPLEDELAAARRAYESLQQAVTDGSASRYDAARQAVQVAEERLTAAIGDALRPPAAAPAAILRRDAPGSPGLLDWTLLVAALGAGIVIGARRSRGVGSLTRPGSRAVERRGGRDPHDGGRGREGVHRSRRRSRRRDPRLRRARRDRGGRPRSGARLARSPLRLLRPARRDRGPDSAASVLPPALLDAAERT